ncbi:MAG: DNA sulfur modification protein DndE [Pelagibacterales bacterium]|nr:DNA sulfur modification protein DndE [Pelagibacterales bacterium]|tara:strand:+ start:3644 stop:4003 length:360 start_codon:yes stop_codon:yes gene_type:complete
MFNNIRTSKENKEVVSRLTTKLGLGPENVIARIAIGYSISNTKEIDINNLQNSSGKTYSYKILFGEYDRIYIAMICQLYSIHQSDPDIPKYIKLHLDDGLGLLSESDYATLEQLFLTNE